MTDMKKLDKKTQRFTKPVLQWAESPDRIKIFINEAETLVEYNIEDTDAEGLTGLLAETIQGVLEDSLPEVDEVFLGLIMTATEQVDFEAIAEPLINDAIEDYKYQDEVKVTELSLMGEL